METCGDYREGEVIQIKEYVYSLRIHTSKTWIAEITVSGNRVE